MDMSVLILAARLNGLTKGARACLEIMRAHGLEHTPAYQDMNEFMFHADHTDVGT